MKEDDSRKSKLSKMNNNLANKQNTAEAGSSTQAFQINEGQSDIQLSDQSQHQSLRRGEEDKGKKRKIYQESTSDFELQSGAQAYNPIDDLTNQAGGQSSQSHNDLSPQLGIQPVGDISSQIASESSADSTEVKIFAKHVITKIDILLSLPFFYFDEDHKTNEVSKKKISIGIVKLQKLLAKEEVIIRQDYPLSEYKSLAREYLETQFADQSKIQTNNLSVNLFHMTKLKTLINIIFTLQSNKALNINLFYNNKILSDFNMPTRTILRNIDMIVSESLITCAENTNKLDDLDPNKIKFSKILLKSLEEIKSKKLEDPLFYDENTLKKIEHFFGENNITKSEHSSTASHGTGFVRRSRISIAELVNEDSPDISEASSKKPTFLEVIGDVKKPNPVTQKGASSTSSLKNSTSISRPKDGRS